MSVIPAFMANTLVREPSKPGLVTKGLVFHLDGLNKGPNPTQWEELISHEPFNLIGCDVLPNAVNFRGSSSSYAESVNITQPFHDFGEFQIAFAPYQMTNSVWFSPPRSHGRNQFSVGQSEGGIVWSTESSPVFRCPIDNRQNYTLSVSKNGITLNTVNATTSLGNNYWPGSYNDNYLIGVRQTLTYKRDAYNGLIYAIRIYNRVLSTEEILQNQTYDRETYFTAQGG